MSLSYDQTLKMINLVIELPESTARSSLYRDLVKINSSEAIFVSSVLDYGPNIKLSSEQWFNFLYKIPNKLLRRDKIILSKLSETQREKLGIS